MILLISIIFIGCSNFQPAKKVISVEYKEGNTIVVTTYEDGSTKVENLEYLRWQRDKEDRRDKKR
ncbi:MAG: hypothetical protein WBG30_06165 [Psychrilyobacter sp.]|uniref:hypothetical protein n=1 Tax=Psychrilyobacter sp. TaxID=2586924 RepID=UPI003C70CF07